MATEILMAAPAAAADRERPYAPSVLDRIYDWLESLPIPIWLAYLALAVPSALLASSAQWLSGLRADCRATDRVDALDRTISALRHERELLAKLPTWPWSAGTIRGFGSALLLPIAVFLVQRFLTQALG